MAVYRTMMYSTKRIPINLSFTLQLALLSKLQVKKSNHLPTNQIPEFNSVLVYN